jgi:hypothetical protein
LGVRLELTVTLVACQDGETALIRAAKCSNLAAVMYLVEHGANVNVKDMVCYLAPIACPREHTWYDNNFSLATVAGWMECMAAADQVKLQCCTCSHDGVSAVAGSRNRSKRQGRWVFRMCSARFFM